MTEQTEKSTEKPKVILQDVTADEADMRLDRWFKAHFPTLRHGALQKLLRSGNIRVDGKRCKADLRLKTGQTVRIPPLPAASEDNAHKTGIGSSIRSLSTEDRKLLQDMIIFEDDDLLVLNKICGLAVQGGTKSNHRNLDRLVRSFAEMRKADSGADFRLTHRLDKETSGLLVFAKNRLAAQKVTESFRHKKTDKTYLALTFQVPMPHEGSIKAPLLKKGDRVIIDRKEGKPAFTDYQVMDHAAQKAALVKLKPETGRTHQLRVHLQSIGTPILGDTRYSSFHSHEWLEQQSNLAPEQRENLYLHAWQLSFPHPRTGKIVSFHAKPPQHFRTLCDILGFALPNK